MKAVILAGGLGTRISEETHLKPKPMLEIGGMPKTAVREYLKTHPEFEIDKQIDNKLLIRVAPDGYLKRVK